MSKWSLRWRNRYVGTTSIAERFETLHKKLVSEFNQIWSLRGNGTYVGRVQTELALALELGVVPEDEVSAVVKTPVGDVKAHTWHVTTGIVGTRVLFQARAVCRACVCVSRL